MTNFFPNVAIDDGRKNTWQVVRFAVFWFSEFYQEPDDIPVFWGGDYWCRLDATDGQALVGFQVSEWPILGGSQVFCGVTNPRD